MGNYKFKFSDMIPNAWFYKLKYSSTTRKQNMKKKRQHQTSSSSSSSSIAASAQQPSKLQQPHLSNQRKSYHFPRDQTAALDQDSFYNNLTAYLGGLDSRHRPEPPRKSSKKRCSTRQKRRSNRRSPRLVTSSVSAGCSCRATVESVWTKPDSTPEDYPNSAIDSSSENESVLPQYGSDVSLIPDTFDGMLSLSTSCRCRVDSDFVIELENRPPGTKIEEPDDKVDRFDKVSGLDLPPIITKPNEVLDKKDQTNNEATKIRRSSTKFEERTAHGSFSVEAVKEDIVSNNTSSKEHKYNNPVRKSSVHSPGVKLRTNSPRIAGRRMQGRKSVSSTSSSSLSGRSLSESFAVVKSSRDPWKDFRESMVEMILENNIFASKDLEDLLACYLSLNSDEYHDLIIKVFKQIWFDITDPRLK